LQRLQKSSWRGTYENAILLVLYSDQSIDRVCVISVGNCGLNVEQGLSRPAYFAGAATVLAGALAVCLRWTGLSTESVWGDEGYTLWLSKFSVGTIWHNLRWDTGPPFYYLLQHYWMEHFGTGPSAIRASSTLFMTLSLPLEYLLIRKVLSTPAARVLAAWLAAFSFLQIWYGKEARFYGLLQFLSLAGVYCLLQYLEKRTLLRLAGVAVCVTASLYTHNITLFYLPGLALLCWFYPSEVPRKVRLHDAVVVAALVGLAYAPWLPSLRAQMRVVHRTFQYPTPHGGDLLDTFSALCGLDLMTFQNFFRETLHFHLHGLFGTWTWGPMVVLAFALLLVRSRKNTSEFQRMLPLVTYAVLPMLLVFVQSRISTPIFQPRYLLASSCVLPLVFCLPFTETRGSRTWMYKTIGILVLLGSVASCYEYPRRYHKDDWRGATAYVLRGTGNPRLVVVAPDLLQYLVRYYAPHPPPGMEITGLIASYDPADPDLQRRTEELEPSAQAALLPESWKKWQSYKEVDLIFLSQDLAAMRPTLEYLRKRCASLENVHLSHLEIERCEMPEGESGAERARR
jgi:hypothetical protein